MAWAMLLIVCVLPARAQEVDTLATEMRDVQVSVMRSRRGMGIETKELVGKGDLIRAACCNLGESFTNSASVDVSYADPTTGVRQVKLLGLRGTYVQMMTENIPSYRGLSMPYALGFVPGTWMQSIQVSKGASSVKNGYESMTGQINIEYLKPQAEKSFHANAYLDSRLRYELNMDGNRHFGGEDSRWSGGYLLHFDHSTMKHDMNHDGFCDDPSGKQVNGMARLAYVSPQYVMQFRGSMLYEDRQGGQKGGMADSYTTRAENTRWDVHLKNAYIYNPEKDGNVALILSASQHRLNDAVGLHTYDVTETDFYASLMLEEQFTPMHALSAGLSMQHDGFGGEKMHFASANALVSSSMDYVNLTPDENVFGAYAQYTFTLDDKLALMAGIRVDRSNLHGTFVTPRAHLRWHPSSWFTMRASAGKGYRTSHVLPEMHYLLASSRRWEGLETMPPQEESWNAGTSWQFSIPLGDKTLELNTDYYYTHFVQQLVVDRDAPGKIRLYALDGRSFSHCLQIEATYPFFEGFSLTAAWRKNHVRTTYQDGRLRETPLTSRWKGLVTATYKTPLELWQVDVTCQLNGPGRMPDPYVIHNSQFTIHNTQLPTTQNTQSIIRNSQSTIHDSQLSTIQNAASEVLSWDKEYKAFPQLSAQVTRFFRWGSVYLGGENLTNFHVMNPIVAVDEPFGKDFDATMIWGPVHGAMAYVGVRVEL